MNPSKPNFPWQKGAYAYTLKPVSSCSSTLTAQPEQLTHAIIFDNELELYPD